MEAEEKGSGILLSKFLQNDLCASSGIGVWDITIRPKLYSPVSTLVT
jgi:hypothetical protein